MIANRDFSLNDTFFYAVGDDERREIWKLPYSERLKDRRWQAKRQEVWQRANRRCERCGCSNPRVQLHVHHLYYRPRLMPWEYPSQALQAVCEVCHNQIEGEKKIVPGFCVFYYFRDEVDLLPVGHSWAQTTLDTNWKPSRRIPEDRQIRAVHTGNGWIVDMHCEEIRGAYVKNQQLTLKRLLDLFGAIETSAERFILSRERLEETERALGGRG